MTEGYTSVSCLVLMDQENSIFVTQRPLDKTLAGLWEFPGGKIEPGESAESALRREIREELDLEVGPLLALRPVVHQYEFGRIKLHPFFNHCEERPAVELNEHISFRWLPLKSLERLELAPADIPILEELESISSRQVQ